MALETATYIASLVTSNPDGADAKATADDHLRLIKAALKRSFPQIDGAVSLSHTQLMRLGDVSASVQLQFNQLREGTATANNAINSRYADSASQATNAINLGGFAAAAYGRLAAVNTWTALQINQVSGEALRLAGADSYIASYNAIQNTRYGYIQFNNSNARLIFGNEMGGATYFAGNGFSHVQINGAVVWNTGNMGAGSGLNADLTDGYHSSEAANGSTLAARTANGYILAAYFNQSSNEAENPGIGSVIVSNGDGFFRKAAVGYFGTQISARNISSKGGTGKTFSAAAPSGGSDGDIWYQT